MYRTEKISSRIKFILAIVILVLLISSIITSSIQADSRAGFWYWRAFESENFVLFFPAGYENQARETLYQLETHRPWIIEFTGNKMENKIHLSLEDIGLLANGYANPVFGKMGIFTGRPDSYSGLANYENWLRLVNIHELIHLGHLTNSTGISTTASRIFGDIMSPNIHSPLWLIEGLAVYGESRISPFEGRLNAGYYDGVLAARSRAADLPSLPEITYRHNHFPGGQQYLYGAAFIRHLSEEYGREKLTELINTYGSYFWAPFIGNLFPAVGLDRAARQVFGQDISQLYQEWRKSEREKHQDWQPEGNKLLEIERGYIDNPAVNPEARAANSGNIYFFSSRNFSSYPFSYHRKNQLISYEADSGRQEVLFTTIGRNFGTLQVTAEGIYYLLGETASGYSNVHSAGTGVSGRLFRYDLESGRNQPLLETKMTDFAIRYHDSPGLNNRADEDHNSGAGSYGSREIIFARTSHRGCGSEIYSYKNGEKEKLGILPEYVSEIKPYQEDLLVVSKPADGTWNISKLKIKDSAVSANQAYYTRNEKNCPGDNTLKLEPLIATVWPEKRLTLRENETDGDSIYFTANYAGYEAIYRYDFNGEKIARLTAGGYAESAVAIEDKLYYTTYGREGMALYQTTAVVGFSGPDDIQKVDSQPQISTFSSEITGAEARDGDLKIQEKQSFSQNLSYLFPPAVRLPPFILMGQDGLAMNSYLIHLNQQGGFNLQLSSRLFQPLEIAFTTSLGSGTNTKGLQLSYPLYRSRLDGLTGIRLDLKTDFRAVRLGSQLNFRYPDHRIALYLEGRPLNQDFRARLGYHYLQEEGRLTLQAGYYDGLKPAQDIREFPRQGSQGYRLALSQTQKLLEIRQGSWNPNLFAGDLFGKIYLDYFNLERKRLSLGAELLLEAGAANLQFVPRLGAAFSEGERKIYLGLELSL